MQLHSPGTSGKQMIFVPPIAFEFTQGSCVSVTSSHAATSIASIAPGTSGTSKQLIFATITGAFGFTECTSVGDPDPVPQDPLVFFGPPGSGSIS